MLDIINKCMDISLTVTNLDLTPLNTRTLIHCMTNCDTSLWVSTIPTMCFIVLVLGGVIGSSIWSVINLNKN